MNKFTLSLMTILFVLSGLMNNVLAQAPEGIIYQAEARDSKGKVLSNSNLDVKISILQDNFNGSLVYEELHNITTSNNGMFVLVIGDGTTQDGFFENVDWGNHPHFLNVQVKETKNNVWTDMGTTQLLSVPYALHAKTAETVIADETDPVYSVAPAASITAADITNLGNLSGTNTGDQDISGIAINAGAIITLQSEQITQNNAIALNTAKTGITPAQATAITDNTANIATNATAISDEEARALAAEGANAAAISDEVARATAAEGINADDILALKAGQITQDAAIALNTAKTGITPAQATAITDNTTNIATNATAISDEEARALAAEGANAAAISDEVTRATAAEIAIAGAITTLQGEQITQNNAIALNTAKTGITTQQASDITANNAKVGITTAQADAITANTAKVGVTNGTNAGEMLYWNGSSWVAIPSGTVGQVLTLGNTGPVWQTLSGATLVPSIGQPYLGGILAYVLQPGDPGYDAAVPHGLIAAPSDQGLAQWGCYGTAIAGALGTALGTGNQNTIAIMNGCATAGIAARLCGDLVLGGYSDWYLPSKAELNKLYLNRVAIGGFNSFSYWSSSEVFFNDAWSQNFGNGLQAGYYKDGPLYVRAVRAF